MSHHKGKKVIHWDDFPGSTVPIYKGTNVKG